MIRLPSVIQAEERSWPRTSGDDPRISGFVGTLVQLAPHERG